MKNNIKICSRCILDTTVTDIWFDEKDECKYCKIHDEMEKDHQLGPSLEIEFKKIIKKIKKDGKNKKYDCIVGVSGGRDSSYTLLTRYALLIAHAHKQNTFPHRLILRKARYNAAIRYAHPTRACYLLERERGGIRVLSKAGYILPEMNTLHGIRQLEPVLLELWSGVCAFGTKLPYFRAAERIIVYAEVIK